MLVADVDTVGVVSRGGGWIGTAMFVAVLVAAFTGVGGGALITVNAAAGAVLVGVSVVAVIVAVLLVNAKRRVASAALPAPWLVFDRAARVVRDANGDVLCSLGEIRIERVFQAGSSSKALAVYCPNKLVIARGTPFGDDVDGIEHALRRVLAEA